MSLLTLCLFDGGAGAPPDMKKAFDNRRSLNETRRRAAPDDAALLDHRNAIDEVEESLEVLVDDEDRLPLPL